MVLEASADDHVEIPEHLKEILPSLQNSDAVKIRRLESQLIDARYRMDVLQEQTMEYKRVLHFYLKGLYENSKDPALTQCQREVFDGMLQELINTSQEIEG